MYHSETKMRQLSRPTYSETIGHWLFRYRSYVPVPLGALVTLSTWNFSESVTRLDFWYILLSVWPISLFILAEAIRLNVVGRAPAQTSGRGRKFEAKMLVTVGPYSYTRNPLYIGNMLFWVGAASFSQNIWVLLVTIVVIAVQYHLIVLAEERYLLGKYPKKYVKYCRETPRYFSLGARRRKVPATSFDCKTGIIRDHDTIFLSVLACWGLIGINLGIFRGLLGPAVSMAWYSVILVAAVVWIVVKLIKHRMISLVRQRARREAMYIEFVTSIPFFECRIQHTFKNRASEANDRARANTYGDPKS